MSQAYSEYRVAFHRAPKTNPSFPVHLDLELAGKCQLACTMCPYGEGTFDDSKQGMMPLSMAYDLLNQAKRGGSLSVKLNFRGEPGLYRSLPHVIKAAKNIGFVETSINTNLTSFSLRRLKYVADAGLDLLIISVDGATKETYESIRIKGDFDKLVERVRYVHGLNFRPKIRVQMVVQDCNRSEKGLMRKIFGPYCDELVFNGIRQDNSGARKQCPQPWQRLVVMWDGQVGACCSNWNNEAIIGRFPEQTLKEIWNSDARKRLLWTAMDPNRGDPCKGCLVGGCYA